MTHDTARSTLEDVARRLVEDYGRAGSKTGRADYIALVPLDRMAELDAALGESSVAPSPVAQQEDRERIADVLMEVANDDRYRYAKPRTAALIAADRILALRTQQSTPALPVEGKARPLTTTELAAGMLPDVLAALWEIPGFRHHPENSVADDIRAAAAELAALLRTPVAPSEEPVAWKVRDWNDGELFWIESAKDAVYYGGLSGFEVTPLFAAPVASEEPLADLSVICGQCGTLVAGEEAGARVKWVRCRDCAAGAAPASSERVRRVGCETEEGWLITHAESETCEVCAPDTPVEGGPNG